MIIMLNMSQLLSKCQPFVVEICQCIFNLLYTLLDIELATILKCNKIKQLTMDMAVLAKAVENSDQLQVCLILFLHLVLIG